MLNLVLKKIVKCFLKIQENIRILILSRRLKKRIIANPQFKTYKMNFKNKKQAKMLNFVLTLEESWRLKNAPQTFSKYLTDKICKIKQYLNHIN